MNKGGVLLVLASLILVLQLSSVFADGGYFPRPGYWVQPGQQRAIIFHEDNVETMIVTSDFRGNAKDMVWIIPTPTRPTVSKANELIFSEIQKLTRPEYRPNFGYGMALEATSGARADGVVVIESLKVDYYDVNILLSSNEGELVDWLTEQGYAYPSKYDYVLNHYIQKGWFFTAIKISPSARESAEVTQDLREGHPTPVKLEFLSDKIVFPLKISSVEFEPEEDELQGVEKYNYYPRYSTPIQIYVIADGKYDAPNFNIYYGNWFDADEIEDLGSDENGDPLISPEGKKYYITSLNANLQKSQMDDDVFFKSTDDDRKVNAGPEAWQTFLYGVLIGLFMFLIFVFSPMGILFIIGAIMLFVSKNHTTRVVGWVLESLALFLSLAIFVTFTIIALGNNALGDYIALSIFITSIILLAIMGFLVLIQLRQER